MKVASFNVNSIRARLPLVLAWLAENQPDVLCTQETKVQDNDFPIEAFDETDLARSAALLEDPADRDRAAAGQLLIGVNTRNLRTLEVDSTRLERLAPLLPAARCVAESGLKTAADAAAVAERGYRMALVGSALMRSTDPAGLVAAMRAAGSAKVAA